MFGNRARKKKENSQPVRVSLTFSFFGDLWDNFATKEKETVGRREDEERETSTSFLSFFFWCGGWWWWREGVRVSGSSVLGCFPFFFLLFQSLHSLRETIELI